MWWFLRFLGRLRAAREPGRSRDRPRHYASNVLLALDISALVVLLAGVVIGAIAGPADIGVTFGDAVLQALGTVPAVWTVVAVSVAVVGAGTHHDGVGHCVGTAVSWPPAGGRRGRAPASRAGP